MRTFLTTLILIFALNSVGFSQRQVTPEEREQTQISSAQRQTDLIAEFLDLTDEQADTIFQINLKFALLRMQLIDETRGGDRAGLRERLDELNEQREVEIMPLLNPEQAELFLENKREAEQRREQMRRAVEERRRTGDLQTDTAHRSLIVPIFTETTEE
ncbi:MAG: hypothetical protein FWC98_05720 [Bacteroidales bacterium]|nr:hypothetical protein [Bacteroidales bacterium]